jgi:hypothetical protein
MRRALPLLSTTRFHKTKAVFTTRPLLLSSPKKKSATALHTPITIRSFPPLLFLRGHSLHHSSTAPSPVISLPHSHCVAKTANKDKYTCIPIPVTVGILWTHALEHFIGSLASSWMKPLGRSPEIFSTFPIVHLSHPFSVFFILPKIRQISLKL